MTKKDDGSQATLVQKLSRPISWQAFVDVMTHEIRLGAGSKQRKDFADLDGEAEKLLAEARLQAERTGTPVEKVLAAMGVLPADQRIDIGAVDRRQLLNQLGWESLSGEFRSFSEMPPHEADQGGETQPARPIQLLDEVACLKRLQESLPRLTLDELSAFVELLSPNDSQLLDQLTVCQVIPAEHLKDAKRAAAEEENLFWLLLLSCGASPERFANLLAAQPWFPLIDEEKGEFADFLAEEGKLSFRQFKLYMEMRKETTTPAHEVLSGLTDDPNEIFEAMATFFSLPKASKDDFPPLTELENAELIPLLRVFDVVPLSLGEEVILGVMRPMTLLQQTLIEERVGGFAVRLLMPDDFEERRRLIAGKLASSRHADARQKARDIGAIREMITNQSAVRLVEGMLEKALEVGATDIHLEYQKDTFRVRFRVDSILQEAMSIHPELADEVISRIKILADMDITERRQPQDGHIKVSIDDKDVNMRVATIPAHRGERISIRLLNSGQVQLTLEDLGFGKSDLAKLDELTKRPYGMILTTGPVGSGKTTTLYSSLSRLNNSEKNILTIEDPVEYEIDGVNQVEVNYRIGFGFVQGLRSILRHDPNTILVGEIRDHETAAIAVRASMTGLLVFSSLHTNDAAGAVTTFYNFQIAPLLIANSLLGVVAQRLVRRLCPSCRELYPPSAEELELFHTHQMLQEGETIDSLARPVGCEDCYFTGYQGRTGIFEMMEVTPDIRDMIMNQASEREIREAAIANGMRLLPQSALEKAKEHITSIEDLRRVVFL